MAMGNFATTLLTVSLALMGFRGVTTQTMFVGNLCLVAGLGLVISAQWGMVKGDTFTYTVLSSFGMILHRTPSAPCSHPIGLFYAAYGAMIAPNMGIVASYGGLTPEYYNAMGFFLLRKFPGQNFRSFSLTPPSLGSFRCLLHHCLSSNVSHPLPNAQAFHADTVEETLFISRFSSPSNYVSVSMQLPTLPRRMARMQCLYAWLQGLECLAFLPAFWGIIALFIICARMHYRFGCPWETRLGSSSGCVPGRKEWTELNAVHGILNHRVGQGKYLNEQSVRVDKQLNFRL